MQMVANYRPAVDVGGVGPRSVVAPAIVVALHLDQLADAMAPLTSTVRDAPA